GRARGDGRGAAPPPLRRRPRAPRTLRDLATRPRFSRLPREDTRPLPPRSVLRTHPVVLPRPRLRAGVRVARALGSGESGAGVGEVPRLKLPAALVSCEGRDTVSEKVESRRATYAEMLRELAQLRSTALVRAFASVPREAFLGRGPWRILRPDQILAGY